MDQGDPKKGVGRRGLVGLFTTHGAKGRGIKSRSFSFFYSFPNQRRGVCHKKKRKCMKGGPQRREWRAQERRIEEEKPAGVSGMATRKRLLVGFEDN